MRIFKTRHIFPALNFLLFAFFILPANVFQVTAQTVVTNEGDPLDITLKPDKETIMLNEPTFISFEIKNYSTKNLCVTEGGDYRNRLGRPDSFNVMVTKDDGKAVPQPEISISMGGLIGCSKIPVNGSHVVKLFVPDWATFETTGNYTFNVKKSLPVQSYSSESSTVIEADVSTHLKVVSRDEKKMGEIIDSLGSVMLDIKNPESGRAAQALAYTDDKRTIKYFAQALEKFGGFQIGTNEYARSRQAAAALSDFDDDIALAALEAAMNSSGEDTRLEVATAFRDNKHPKALELLLRMQNDSYYFVRLRVVQGLSRLKSDETLIVLHKMLKDKNKTVREGAQVSLNTRGQE